MKSIASRDNPTFKALRLLAEDGRLQRREGRTLLDGPHLVAEYLSRVGLPELLLVSDSGLGNAEVADILERSGSLDAICLKDGLFAEISPVATPVGIAAVIPIPAVRNDPITESCALLENVQDAGNIGSILRSAAAAGIGHVVLGPGCAGVWTPKVLRAAQGAHFSLDLRERGDLIGMAKAYPGLSIATVATGDSRPLYGLDLKGPVAWIFGNEGGGLSPELAAAAKIRATIPLAATSESLNVAAAAAVCFFEASRQIRGG